MGILFGFVPLIVYGLLAGPSVQSKILALGAATLVTVVVSFGDLKKGRILTWANLVLFGGLLIATVGFSLTGILSWSGVLIYMVLAAVAFGSILAGVPFTLQYAREMVDPSRHENPVFLRVNILMTGIWGGIYVVNALLDYLALVFPGPGRTGRRPDHLWHSCRRDRVYPLLPGSHKEEICQDFAGQSIDRLITGFF